MLSQIVKDELAHIQDLAKRQDGDSVRNAGVARDRFVETLAQEFCTQGVDMLTQAGIPKAMAQRSLMFEVLRQLFGTKPDTANVRIVADLEPTAPGKIAVDIQVKKS